MLEVIKISTYGIKQSYLNCLLCGNKVNELSRENLSQQQIAIKIGIHRDTVRRYQIMSESEFNEHLNRESTPLRNHALEIHRHLFQQFRSKILVNVNAVSPFPSHITRSGISDNLQRVSSIFRKSPKIFGETSKSPKYLHVIHRMLTFELDFISGSVIITFRVIIQHFFSGKYSNSSL